MCDDIASDVQIVYNFVETSNSERVLAMKTVNYTLRIDEGDKQRAESVFKALGMTFSTGINVYLKAVGRQQRIPFVLNIGGEVPARTLADAFKSAQSEAVKNGTSEMTMDEINAEIASYRLEKRNL